MDVVEDAFVLCAGGRVEAVGRMRDLPALDADVEEIDGTRSQRDPRSRRLPHAPLLRG